MLGRASGRHLHALAHNRDPRPVVGRPPPRLDRVAARARAIGRAQDRRRRSMPRSSRSSTASPGACAPADRIGRTVVLRLRFDDFTRATRSHTLPHADRAHRDDPRDRARAARRGDAEDRARRAARSSASRSANLDDDGVVQLALAVRPRGAAVRSTPRSTASATGSVRQPVSRAVLLGRDQRDDGADAPRLTAAVSGRRSGPRRQRVGGERCRR